MSTCPGRRDVVRSEWRASSQVPPPALSVFALPSPPSPPFLSPLPVSSPTFELVGSLNALRTVELVATHASALTSAAIPKTSPRPNIARAFAARKAEIRPEPGPSSRTNGHGEADLALPLGLEVGEGVDVGFEVEA
jgi:hypothetical protein